jgi:hypothetical protein
VSKDARPYGRAVATWRSRSRRAPGVPADCFPPGLDPGSQCGSLREALSNLDKDRAFD